MIRTRVVVEGRVQGVGYRAACARQARTVGVNGWFRNRTDGTVEAVFEGVETAVDAADKVGDWDRGLAFAEAALRDAPASADPVRAPRRRRCGGRAAR